MCVRPEELVPFHFVVGDYALNLDRGQPLDKPCGVAVVHAGVTLGAHGYQGIGVVEQRVFLEEDANGKPGAVTQVSGLIAKDV